MNLKPGRYRPTTLKMSSRHCPRAINFYEDGAPYDRSIFHIGTAAHAVVQGVIEATKAMGSMLDPEEFEAVSLAVCERMIRDGRTFEGRPDPPMPIDAVWAGRDLARRYLQENPIDPDTGLLLSERGIAVDSEWTLTRYQQDVRFRLIIDMATVFEIQDEETAGRLLLVRDFKSAWPTDRSELDTVQMKAQAVLAWKFISTHHTLVEGELDGIRLEVVNLRTHASYHRDLWMMEDGGETLERWREELDATMTALDEGRDANGRYRVAPGGGCMGCPYISQCEPGKNWADRALEHETTEDRAAALQVLDGQRAEIIKILKKEVEQGPVELPDGRFVGIVGRQERAVNDVAWHLITEQWLRDGGEAFGLLKACGLGVRQVENVAKAVFPEREEIDHRQSWVRTLMGSKIKRRFGIHEKETVEQDLARLLEESLKIEKEKRASFEVVRQEVVRQDKKRNGLEIVK